MFSLLLMTMWPYSQIQSRISKVQCLTENTSTIANDILVFNQYMGTYILSILSQKIMPYKNFIHFEGHMFQQLNHITQVNGCFFICDRLNLPQVIFYGQINAMYCKINNKINTF